MIESDCIEHECGVAAVHARDLINIPEKLFFTLFAQQHRGQESTGVAYRKDGRTVVYKDLGMVSTVLARYLERERLCRVGIGHVRYSTHGGNKLENAQPILVDCNKGEIALAHNGNIANMPIIKERLFAEGSIFQTSSDSELILHLLSRSRAPSFLEALHEVLPEIEGAYSMVLMHDDTLIAVRDPSGFRPLYVGEQDGVTVVASETCALDIVKISNYRELEPGEVLIVDHLGARSEHIGKREAESRCVFELIYFARPDSQVFGHSVHTARKAMGRAIAGSDEVEADIVVPIPDSGNSAALGYAEASGTPLEFGLTRNHYAGRSFIMPTTAERDLAVRMKLHPVREVIEGRRVVLVDDSLVRGTTARLLVRLVREAGAREVHLRLCSPEIRWPCFFGIDIPTRRELISNAMSPGEIARYIRADSVRFLTLEELQSCLNAPGAYCYACFSGAYPIEVPLTDEERAVGRERDLREMREAMDIAEHRGAAHNAPDQE